MREIKCRFWDKQNKTMALQSHVRPVFIKDEENANVLELKADMFEVMLSTGLKDKNGKEIFEDDLVKYSDEPACAQVKYDDSSGSFRLRGLNGWQGNWYWFGLFGLEVVGNIWENPELLKI